MDTKLTSSIINYTHKIIFYIKNDIGFISEQNVIF